MQQWNHQLPIKATAAINFSSGRLSRGAADVGARDLLRELTRTRSAFLEALGSLASTPDAVVKVGGHAEGIKKMQRKKKQEEK